MRTACMKKGEKGRSTGKGTGTKNFLAWKNLHREKHHGTVYVTQAITLLQC